MKKLLFVISQLYRGGAETSLVNLLNNLDENKYEVDLLVLDQSPVKDAISLMNKIPKWVRVCDAYKGRNSIVRKIRGKFIYNEMQKGKYYISALDFVRNKMYDWAFFVGEWYDPEFVATYVHSHKKAAWIHNDLSKAEYFNAELYFQYYDSFDRYIFVSQKSLEASCKIYKFLKDKAITIYNISDVKNIKLLANEKVEDYKFGNKPTLVTCANFRHQKNHLRQLEVMKILKEKGIEFCWVNIGALTDKELVAKIKKLAKDYGLENDFLILGPKENPYKYLSKADAVTVLSNYESWSMVITESKILGTPVISTKTSGAIEQIENEKTGIISDFSTNEIANCIEKFIKDKSLQNEIRNNINNFDNTQEIIDEFDKLINGNIEKKVEKSFNNKILYVIDQINYLGGAHIATKLQIKKLLEKNQDITIFSDTIPNPSIRNELLGVEFLSWKDLREDIIFNMKLIGCLTDKFVSIEEKLYKCRVSFYGKICRLKDNFEKNVVTEFSKLFSKYDLICVMSEGSLFKKAVANSKCKRKIQWIHIDYCDWRNKNDWTRKVSKDDSENWKSYDDIIVLTEKIKDDFSDLYPHLSDKVSVLHNIMPVEEIKRKSDLGKIESGILKFVTVGRVDKQKAYDRLIPILARLRDDGYRFYWSIIGDGNEFKIIRNLINENELDNMVFLEGAKTNPFPYIKNADIFALMPDFEGLPNTIYESLILGIPVIATNVGGINTQVLNGKTGWLVENEEESIYLGIKHILDNPNEIEQIKNLLVNYKYDNESIYNYIDDLFIGN